MALEAMNQIKKAEIEAEEKILNAKKASKEIIALAQKEAADKYNQIIEDAKQQAQKLLQKAVEEGNSEAEPILQVGLTEIDSIKNMSQEIKERAINIVVERIVKIHGNS